VAASGAVIPTGEGFLRGKKISVTVVIVASA
jgi:hypothetical protein